MVYALRLRHQCGQCRRRFVCATSAIVETADISGLRFSIWPRARRKATASPGPKHISLNFRLQNNVSGVGVTEAGPPETKSCPPSCTAKPCSPRKPEIGVSRTQPEVSISYSVSIQPGSDPPMHSATRRVHSLLRPTTAAATDYPAIAAIRPHHCRECNGFGTTRGGRLTMKNDLKAFLLSAGGLLAVAGSGLLVLWAVLS
jgi:hypothetical protein